MPSTLPTSMAAVETFASTSSATRFCFSSTTPIPTNWPNTMRVMNRMSTEMNAATPRGLEPRRPGPRG